MAGWITKKSIASLVLPRSGNRIAYDREIPGFGVRITSRGVVAFVLTYRINGRERRFTLGRFPDLSVMAAREEAIQLRGRILRGQDPLAEREQNRTAPTVSDLAEDYLERHAKQHKRPSSVRNDQHMLDGIIRPKLGRLRVDAVRRRDIETLHHSLKATPYLANRVLALFSKMFSLAVEWDWIAANPARGIARFHEEKRDRWLSQDELKRLRNALDQHLNQSAANAVRLILLTGARKGEILSAKWEQFNLERGEWTKPSAHTKQKRTEHVPLSEAALRLLREMKKRADGECLFPGAKAGEPLRDLKHIWGELCRTAKLEGARLHDLRHTYASHLVSGGFSLAVVGRLLGHTQPQTTARYAHLANAPLREAANLFAQVYEGSEGTARVSGKQPQVRRA